MSQLAIWSFQLSTVDIAGTGDGNDSSGLDSYWGVLMKPNPDRLSLVSKLAEVRWSDTNCNHAWSDAEARSTICQSVGYVILDDEDEIVLAESINLGTSSTYGCQTAIPKHAIIGAPRYLKGKK